MTSHLLLGLILAVGTPALASAPDDAAVASTIPFADLVALDGTPMPSSALTGNVVLFVNVASRCGYTGQYDGLQALYESHKDKGLVIVGVPCNQFGGQEPGSPKEIASFCRMNYGVSFPLLEKQSVKGDAQSALYSWLVGSEVGGGKDVRWNFEKFLIGRDGAVLERFGSGTTPDDPQMLTAIQAALGAT